MPIRVTHIPFPEVNQMNAWVAWCPRSREALVVDPGGWDERIPDLLEREELSPVGIFLTHGHWDHTGGVGPALERLDVPVLASAPTLTALSDQVPQGAGRPLADGDRVRVGGHEGLVHEVTGHTEDQLVLYLEGHLLAGDTIFAAALGGTADVERFHRQAGRVRRLLFRLPADVVVHPGHGPVTEVGLERLFNPFLKGTEPNWKTALGGW